MPTPLIELLDSLSAGVLVLDAITGELAHRNRAMITLLGEEPDSSLLFDAALQLGNRWRRLSLASGAPPRGSALLSDVRLATNCAVYRLWGTAPQLEHTTPAQVLVLVERLGFLLPTAARLRAHFRLTPREVEVALLLAEGASDAHIGRALGMSIHTARHHGERIFAKVGVHSRKALVLHLV
ncbi:MAG: helix-turn-helix transcriptional regulator [Gemmatimonadota bacterium]|nr:helix-turn-helix transcriptional regulator [Gemmatimonadota bacterium]